MPVYNFKKIGPVPSANDLVDIVLTRTQRRTPTVVHPGYKISRIRAFYIRKVKFTQQTISERLSAMLTDFPRLDDIHPFYADLCNTLYDRDHYKLALGQINTARSLVESVARDMIRMIKFGDSLYRCKCLKRAALGRMCTILKRQKAALAYLEQVRKHLMRLPALDPNTRTILICGLPNVGKSSFMNKITNGNVEVQPYAFTTKSLFVGHCDYNYLRWQIIDTPGLLDDRETLEERNTIEMQAIVALAHLTCSVLYFVDISEQCGYTIERQCSLFRSIQPLFANKQLIVVANKIDQQSWESLEDDKKQMIQGLCEMANNCSFLTMSNTSEQGISRVKSLACDKLLAARVDARVGSKKVDSVMNRLQVFYPAPRDNVVREPHIPETVLRNAERDEDDHKPKRTSNIGYAPTIHDDDDDIDMTKSSSKKTTARDVMWQNGGPGVWAPDYREQYDLNDPEWRFDAIPEIINGKNIADYIDPDIQIKLQQLEQEEEQLASEQQQAEMEDIDSDLDSEEEAVVQAIRDRKKITRLKSKITKTQNKPMNPRKIRGVRADDVEHTMDNLGVDSSKMLERGRTKERESRKRGRSLSRAAARSDATTTTASSMTMDDDDNIDVEMQDGTSKTQLKKAKRARREESLARSHSRPREPSQVGLKDEKLASVAKKLQQKQGNRTWAGASGEGDHRKSVHLVKWMNTGKKRMGTHYCR